MIIPDELIGHRIKLFLMRPYPDYLIGDYVSFKDRYWEVKRKYFLYNFKNIIFSEGPGEALFCIESDYILRVELCDCITPDSMYENLLLKEE